jgi:hypothetical protein
MNLSPYSLMNALIKHLQQQRALLERLNLQPVSRISATDSASAVSNAVYDMPNSLIPREGSNSREPAAVVFNTSNGIIGRLPVLRATISMPMASGHKKDSGIFQFGTGTSAILPMILK